MALSRKLHTAFGATPVSTIPAAAAKIAAAESPSEATGARPRAGSQNNRRSMRRK